MYQTPTAQPPTLKEVENIADNLRLGIDGDDIKQYHDLVKELITRNYPVLEKYVEPAVPIKYPRTPGYRPQPEDNKYNAWYYKTDIPGAASGPLHGYKVAIKDNFPVAGVPMMFGSRVMEGYVPDFDATIVTRLLDAGGKIVGKAVCENMTFSGSSFTSCPSPVLNPYDTSRTSGGSSSGSAVLVHTGEVDIAIGNDAGGSIRMPAAWTGIVGHKPTRGLVPHTGLANSHPQVEVVGPMARTVKDCALMLEAIAGDDDEQDPRQVNIPKPQDIPKYSQLLTGDISGCRIGLVQEGFKDCKNNVDKIVRDAAMKLTQKGAVVEDVSIPIHDDGDKLVMPCILESYYHLGIQGNGYLVGPPCKYFTSSIANFATSLRSRRRDYPICQKVAAIAGQYIDDNYGLYFYGKSQNLLRMVREKYDEVLNNYDFLIMPTMKQTAPKLPAADISVADYMIECFSPGVNTFVFNGTGHPALSINAGFSDGLPVGMQIVGKHMQDQQILNVAYAFEQIRETTI